MKNQLLNLKMIVLMCLMMVLGGANVWAQETVTIWSEDWTGQKADATPSSINSMYSQGQTSTKIYTTGDMSAGGVAPELLLASKDKWTIEISDLKGCSGEFTLSFHTNRIPTKSNAISVSANGNILKLSVDKSDNKLCTGKFNVEEGRSNVTIIFNNTTSKNARIDDIVLTGTKVQTKKLTFLAISGQPTKTTYEVGEEFDPTGLVVTGTYDDNTTATITNGITWTKTPATLSLSDVSCSVTATVDGVTSPAYNVTGLTVNKAKLPATITLTGNATTLGVDDEPNTFTVDYDGDGTLSATASAEGVVDLALVGNIVTVTPKAVGSVDITVAATEGTEYKAASKTYTVNVVPVGIAAIRNSITSKRDKEAFTAVKLKDAVVTYSGKTSATADKNTIYVEDKTAGVVFYVDDLNYEAGDVLNGTISGEGFVYQGLTEVTSIDASSNIVVTKNGVIPCQEVTVDELNKNMDKWESRRVKLLDVTVSSAMDSRNAKISQDGNTIAVYEKIRNCSGDLLSKVNTKIASIVCYPQDHNTTNQLCVWEESDIVVATAVPTYTAQTLTLKATDGSYKYSTFSSDKVTFFPEAGLIPCAITVANGKINQNMEAFAQRTETINNDEVPGYYIPANTGVMFMSDAADVTYYTVENKTVDALAEGTNMLMPSVAGGEFTAEPGKVYYKLAYNNYEDKTGLGFYWGAENGGAFSVKAGTAYLAVPAGDATAKGFAFNGEATGIDGVNANVENAKAIYNLNGQRVASMAKPGLYIVNGKKVVRK